MLPGRTVRLRLTTPGYQTWAPGQHFLVSIPALSRIDAHPFSVASVCDEQAALHVAAPGDEDEGSESGGDLRAQIGNGGREMILLIRAKKEWTKRLWELVSSLQPKVDPYSSTPGALVRVLVDGPYGSAARVRWGAYSGVLIVAGGSGAAFGLSILEFICLCLAGRDGRFLGGHPGGWGVGPQGRGRWVCKRVRFVWVVREFAHIQVRL